MKGEGHGRTKVLFTEPGEGPFGSQRFVVWHRYHSFGCGRVATLICQTVAVASEPMGMMALLSFLWLGNTFKKSGIHQESLQTRWEGPYHVNQQMGQRTCYSKTRQHINNTFKTERICCGFLHWPSPVAFATHTSCKTTAARHQGNCKTISARNCAG